MHLLATNSTGLDEIVEAVDLGQPPGDIAVLSFADSDLAGLAAAWAIEREALPSVRLAQPRDPQHPMLGDPLVGGRLGDRTRGAAERAARAAARPQASDVGRPLDRARRPERQGDRGAVAWR